MGAHINLQDAFLNRIRKENAPVTIFLTNGSQLNGLIRGFDNFIILLSESDEEQQMIYKHAISAIRPSAPLRFNFNGDNQ
jgi:host factor-I protein